jgi:transposase InsO family protein
MRHTAAEKLEAIKLVENSDVSVRRTLQELGLPRSTFYDWYERYKTGGVDALEDRKPGTKRPWHRIPERVRSEIVELALEQTQMSPRELACTYTDQKRYFVSESSVYRILKDHDLITSPAYVLLKAADHFKHPTHHVHELWQTDFTYFRVVGWGWYYLSTVLDDYSRYIVSWRLSPTMAADDVTKTLDMALEAAGLQTARVRHRPRLLSDNGPAYLSSDLREYLGQKNMTHTRGAPYHPMTQGKIERWHRSMKNVVKLNHYYAPGELEQAVGDFVEYYNNDRFHESLDNVTPADVYFGRRLEILTERDLIKAETMEHRRRENAALAA